MGRNGTSFCKQRRFDFEKQIACNLLNLEIRDINFHMNFLNKSLSSLKNLILNLNIDNLTINNFFTYTNKKCKLIREKHNRNLIKKFVCLAKKQRSLLINSTSKVQFFKNLTDVQIPDDIIDVVSLGPKFRIKKGCDKKDIVDTVKNVEFSLMNSELSPSKQSTIRQKIVTNLTSAFFKQRHVKPQDKIFKRKLTP